MDSKERILIKINKLIEKYNSISDDKMSLVQDKVLDTRNLYLCLYDDDKVDIFEKETYFSKVSNYYTEIDVYYGIGTDNTMVHLNYMLKKSRDKWYEKGQKMLLNGEYYSTTCKVNMVYSLENIRQYLYQINKLDTYEFGQIRISEIPEMINYAYSYFNVSGKQKVFK